MHPEEDRVILKITDSLSLVLNKMTTGTKDCNCETCKNLRRKCDLLDYPEEGGEFDCIGELYSVTMYVRMVDNTLVFTTVHCFTGCKKHVQEVLGHYWKEI